MGRLIDADAFRNKLVEMTNDPFASTNRPLNWSHAYESVMVELDRMPNAQGWISVEDRLPEAGQFVLAYYGNFYGYIVEVMEWTGELWRNSERIAEIPDVITHWMPLPEPPKEG